MASIDGRTTCVGVSGGKTGPATDSFLSLFACLTDGRTE